MRGLQKVEGRSRCPISVVSGWEDGPGAEQTTADDT